VSDDLIVNCSITSIYGKHRLYIKQIFFKNDTARIALSSVFDDVAVGVFSGEVLDDYTTLTLTPFTRNVAGSITLGSLASLAKIPRILNFEKAQSELEESTIFCYVPPAVTSIADSRGNSLRGQVNFGVLTNVAKTTEPGTTKLASTSPETVENIADKSSALNNCKNPVIKSINGVAPFPVGLGAPENDGNMYLVGINPVVFYGVPDEAGSINIETGAITLDSLCTQKRKLIPPSDVSGFILETLEAKNMYYTKTALPASDELSVNYPYPRPARSAGTFNNTVRPEYYFWPQFVKEEYYNYWT
jgi:hypothetical protein